MAKKQVVEAKPKKEEVVAKKKVEEESESESDSSSSSSSESEDEKQVKAKAAPAKAPVKGKATAPAKKEESESESESSSSESEEEKPAPKAEEKKAAPKKEAPKAVAKKEEKKPAKKEESESESESSGSESEKEEKKMAVEEEEEEEEKPVQKKKRMNEEGDAQAVSQPKVPAKEEENKTVRVTNLSYNSTEDMVREKFSECGGVQRVKLLMDRETGRSKGMAFVEYDTIEAMQAALKLDGSELDGREIHVGIAMQQEPRKSFGGNGAPNTPREKNPPSKVLFVGNLAFEVTEEMLQQAFAECGTVTSARIAKDPEGNPKGFGHMEFESVEEAKKAMAYDQTDFAGRKLRLDFATERSNDGGRGGFGGRGGGRGGFGGRGGGRGGFGGGRGGFRQDSTPAGKKITFD